MLTGNLEIQIETPIKISVGGEFADADILIVTAPSAKNFKEVSKLKGIIFSSIAKQAKQNQKAIEEQTDRNEENKSNVSSEDINNLIYMMSDDVDYFDVANLVKQILIHGCATMLEQKFTATMYDKLTISDIEKITGEVIAHFLKL